MGRTRAGVLSIRIGACLATASLLAAPASAAPLFDFPVTVRQPDGTAVDLLASGDEFANRLHDADGFTVLRDPVTGLWVYADRAGDRLAPTRLVAGASDPRELGLVPDLWPSPRPDAFVRRAMRDDRPRAAPLAGTLNNLVVFIRFADEPELTDPISTYETMFNDPVEGHASLYGYYREASYGKLAVRSHFFPQPTGGTVVSFQDSHPRAYYQPYHATVNPDGYQEMSQVLEREANLLSAAVSSVASQIPTDLDLDGDDDGTADNINFVVSGKPDAWADLLWPHMSFITKYTEVNGVIVMYYNFQLHDVLMDGKHLGVLAHEMFHTLGSPDLYHYDRDGFSPAGFWDLMERDLPIPQHMSAYMKRRVAGWVPPIPEITANGEYALNPLTSPEGNAWRVAASGSATEYFVLEYRRAMGTYEASLPGSGLVVWRIDGALESFGNADGPPDEVFVMRPGGSPLSNGNVRDAYLGPHVGRPRLAEDASPYAFLQDGSRVPFRVYDISEPGDTITFKVCMKAPDCAGRECGDDGCGGSCGACPAGRTCEEGLCGGDQDCSGYLECRDACGDEACGAACRDRLTGAGQRAEAALLACVSNRCEGIAGVSTLAHCLDVPCAAQLDACLAGASAASCADVADCLDSCPADDDGACLVSCRTRAPAGVLDRVRALRACAATACPVCAGPLASADDVAACAACRTAAASGACRQEFLACIPDGSCMPDCGGRACGWDGCGGSCGACGAGLRCDASGVCVECSCDGRDCGGDGCGKPCGTCASGKACDGSGACVPLPPECPAVAGPACNGHCVPACPSKACGDDGCGGECPPCPAATEACSTSFCNAGICATWPARDGWPCDDQDLCSPGDFCSSGACTVTATRPCKSADPCHLDGVCDPATGDCSRPDAPEGTPCDDRDPTLAGATCDGKGECVVPAPPDGLEDAAEETADEPESGRPDEAIEDVAPELAPEPLADAVESAPETSAQGSGGCNAGQAPPGAWALLAGLLAALMMRRTGVA